MSRQINTKAELIELIREMSAEDTSRWDNSEIGTFLEALSGWIGDCDGYYTNTGSDIDPRSASWQIFADALQAAKIYE